MSAAAPAISPVAVVLVVAVAENGVIGRDDALPWRIRSDLKYFRSVTMNKPVVMGRKTYASIGKPLPGRTNIVVTRQAGFAERGVLAAPGLDQALSAARGDALRRGTGEIAVIGGAEIFAQALPLADRIALTRVHASPQGDTFWPPIDATVWRETAHTPHERGPGDDYGFTIVQYERAARHERAL